MMENIWDYLNLWLRKKFKQSFTTDGSGNTAIRVVGNLVTTSDAPNLEEVMIVTLTNGGTEYPINLPVKTKRYTIYCRDEKKVLLAYLPGDTASNYLTISPGETHDSNRVNYDAGETLYVKTSSNNIRLELKIQRLI